MTARLSLDSFLPMDRRQALAGRSADPPDRSTGTALFADLSGFTRLTEALVEQLGPRRGVEQLSAHIGRVYEGLLEGVHRHRGSVVTFIGDALVVWFESEHEADARPAAGRAVRAAGDMQRAMQRFQAVGTPGGATVAFAARVGLAVGPVRRLLVGTPGRGQFDVLAGSTVDRAIRAETAARPGEIVADETIPDLTGATVFEWRSPPAGTDRYAVIEPGADDSDRAWPDLGKDPLPEMSTSSWLPPVVVRRFEAGTEFISELRSSVPLFVQFNGLAFDADDEVEEKLDRFVDGVQEILDPLEGMLLQVIAGDKGSHLYIVFGAPVGHDDDEARALAAALNIRSLSERLPFLDSVRIGLNSGRVFAGLYGAPSRLSYAVIGDPVNLAARLMGRAAEGQILLTRRVANRAGNAFEAAPIGEIRVKGRDASVEVLEARGRAESRRSRAADESDLIGRRDELQRLLAAVAGAKSGESGILAVEGEAGIGKSRLLDELATRAGDGVRVVRGYADVVERRREYHAWRNVFADLLDLRAGEAREARLGRVRAAVERLSPDDLRRLPLLSTILDLALEDSDLTRHMTGEIRANNTISMLTGLLQAAAGSRPLMIVLEDAHWFDTPSWSLLHAIRRNVDPVLLVVSSRPHRTDAAEEDASEYGRMLADRRCERVELGALEPDEAATLAATRIGAEELPDRVSKLVRERSEGHPLFAQEIVLALRDAGALIVEGGNASLAGSFAADEFDVPDTIEGVVTSRIDRLTAEQQLIAKVASVIGRTFDVPTLTQAFPAASEPAYIEEHLGVLVDRALLQPPADPGTYSFSHSIIRDVTYDTLLYAQRRTLHRSVAESIEASGGDEQGERFSVLAHHWEHADEPPLAVDYLEKAGEHAVTAFANAEAITFLTRAEKLVTEHADRIPGDAEDQVFRRARWRRLTGEARNGIGEFDRSHDEMRASLELLGRPEPGPAGMALRLVGELARQSSHRRLRPGLLTRQGNARAALESARVYHDLVYPYYVSGNWLGGLYANWYMLNTVERFGGAEASEGLLPIAKTNVAGAWLNILHNRKVGDRYLDEAREHATAEGDIPSLAYSYLVEGMVRVFNCDLEEAHTALEQALHLYGELGHPRRLDDTTYTMATWHFFTGDLDRSLEVSRDLLRSGRARDDIESQLLALGQEALCHLYAGRYAEAVERAAESRALARSGESMAEQIFAAGVATLAHTRHGDGEEAREAAQYTDGLLDSVKISNLAIEGFSCLAEALLVMRETGDDVPSAQRPLTALKKNANALSRIHRPRGWLMRGWQAALDGKFDKARNLLGRCMEAASDIGLPYEEARAGLELARLSGSGKTADELLASAETAFERMGMPWELERVRTTRTFGANP